MKELATYTKLKNAQFSVPQEEECSNNSSLIILLCLN